MRLILYILFFFNDPATTEIYTLSLHDALPISTPLKVRVGNLAEPLRGRYAWDARRLRLRGQPTMATKKKPKKKPDRKSTRLNSSHSQISYAVFCLKKKKTERT